ncbi:hypothetical protein Leryth_013711 [Lithospermum erythrorhizon]|nr:hypothetical protein Leryth_013711 [Lithospermum erythrorhizon]
MTTNVNHQIDDQMGLISQYYPGIYTQLVPDQVEVKPRRRRRKNKEASSSGFRKRKLSEEQMNMLEKCFGDEHKLESERKDKLASELGLDPRQVAVWFQNRRARWKNKKLEEEYSKLKNEHETSVLENCRLETEVLNLKDRLGEAEKEIQRLLERASINSPNSSSMEVMEPQPPFLGEFGMEGLENVFYVPEYTNYANGFEWVNL